MTMSRHFQLRLRFLLRGHFMNAISKKFFALISALFALAFASTANAVIPPSERAVLLALYASTNGASWSNNGNWGGAAGTECSWYGITCSAGDANVTEIRLGEVFAGNNLTGTLPSTLNQLTELRRLQFDDNVITGSVPPLSGLASLEYFSISSNALDGSLPPLAGLTALQYFDVSGNNLGGELPSLTGLESLEFFYAYGNRFQGLIPSLVGLTQLLEFTVNENRLTGSIPSLSGLTNLYGFNVSDNQLTGTVPSLAGLDALIRFHIDNNQLKGAVPAVPAPTNALLASESELCPNQLTVSVDPAWDAATGSVPWSDGCIAPRVDQTLTFGPPPVLTPGSSGNVSVTVSPLPGSQLSIVYRSLTRDVCDSQGMGPGVTALPTAPIGSVCVIAADKPGDENANTAPRAKQSIVISAPTVTAVNAAVPTLGLAWTLLLSGLLVLLVRCSLRTRSTQPRT
jgi:hypothetical protein